MLYETRITLILRELKSIATNQHGWQYWRYWKESENANGIAIHTRKQ